MKTYEIKKSIDNANELQLDRFLLPEEASSADDDIMLFVQQKLFRSDQYGYSRGLDPYFSTLNI